MLAGLIGDLSYLEYLVSGTPKGAYPSHKISNTKHTVLTGDPSFRGLHGKLGGSSSAVSKWPKYHVDNWSKNTPWAHGRGTKGGLPISLTGIGWKWSFFFPRICLESSPGKVGLILCGLFCFNLLRKMGDDPACLGLNDLKGKTKNEWLLTLSAWVEDKLESKMSWGKWGLLIINIDIDIESHKRIGEKLSCCCYQPQE